MFVCVCASICLSLSVCGLQDRFIHLYVYVYSSVLILFMCACMCMHVFLPNMGMILSGIPPSPERIGWRLERGRGGVL